jgi:spermidine/putrescine transport system substrate-binding protein
MLVGAPDRRVGRRGFLRTAALLAAAGAAGYAGGTVAGLGRDDDRAAAPAGDAAPAPGNRRNERLLNIYNWSDYIDDRTIPLFQALTNIRINYDVFSSNEDLLAKMKAGSTPYDIIVPTNWFVPTYLNLDLIEPLRQDLIPNLTNLDREFVQTDYDPGNRFTVPWQWGRPGSASTGPGCPAEGRLLGGAVRPRPGGQRPRHAAARGLRPDRLRADLPRQEPQLDQRRRPGRGGQAGAVAQAEAEQVHHRHLHRRARRPETWLAQVWSGDAFQAQEQNPDISYTIPKEGSLRFVDVMCVPKGAPHPGNAARFMNYVLHPKVQARISKYVSYGTPVSLAKPLLPSSQVSDPSIYPPASVKLSIVTLTGQKLQKWQAAYDQIIK